VESVQNPSTHRSASKPKGGVFAREPVLQDLGKLLGLSAGKDRSHKIPLLVIFGDNDWLNYESSADDVQHLKNVHGVNAKFDIISDAGHHLYIENPSGFAKSLLSWENENKKL